MTTTRTAGGTEFEAPGRPEADALPLVTVVMPVRNEVAHIDRSLGAVLGQDYPPERLQVLVVDGMSADGTRERVLEMRDASPSVLVTLVDNPGRIAPKALNAGLREARGEVVVRVDGHCEVAPDYVRRCVEHLSAGGWAGVGGQLETVGETPTARSIALAMSVPFGVGGGNFRTMADREVEVDTVAFPAYPRTTLESAGPYDEELVRNQDDEYNYRIRKAGGRLLLAPDVRARYYSRASFGRLWRQYLQYGFWKVRVMQKHPGQMRARQFAPGALVGGLGLAFGLAAAGFVHAWAVGALASVYALGVVLASFLVAGRHGWGHLVRLPVAFSCMHMAYGLGFLAGLVRFAVRWGDATTEVGGRRVVVGVSR